jgi:hypothetical protein
MESEVKLFWTIVSQLSKGALLYFTGNVKKDGRIELSISVHNAIEFATKEEAEFGLFMLGDTTMEVQEHQIGW